MITAALDLFEETDQETARRELPTQARLFLQAVNDAASKYEIPGYTAIVIVPELITASVGGFSDQACTLLAEANVQLAEKIKELMVLQMAPCRGKPS